MSNLLATPTDPPGVRARTRSAAGQLEMDYVVTPRSVRIARAIVGAHLDLWGLGVLADRAELALSELLTNVWRHTRPNGDGQRNAQITLTRTPDGVALLVHDSDPALPILKSAASSEESGRGLQLVTAVADRFGVSLSPSGGKDVWLSLLQPEDEGIVESAASHASGSAR